MPLVINKYFNTVVVDALESYVSLSDILYVMVLHRNTFFIYLFLLFFAIIPGPTIIWIIRSEKATGLFSFEGKGNALDQFPQQFSYIYFNYKGDTVLFKGPPGLGL